MSEIYHVVGREKIRVDENVNDMYTEVREFHGMSKEDVEDMLQEATYTNEKGEEVTVDLRYL